MNNDDTINNAIIKVATLEKEYDVVLKQYQEAYKNYISVLNLSSDNPCENYKLESKGVSQECYNKIWSDQGCTTQAPDWGYQDQTYDQLVNDSYIWSTSTDEQHRKGCYNNTTTYNTKPEPTYSLGKDFVELPGRTWWGTYGIKEGASNTKEDCISMCASDSKCTGSTFNSVKRYCWTRGGEGTISTGLSDDSALIPKLKVSILILDGLNNKLLSINQQLKTEIRKINPLIKSEKDETALKQKKFDDSYTKLYKEKNDLKNLLNEYDSVESELNNETLVVEQSNASLKLWTFFAFLLILLIINQLYGSESHSSVFIIIILVLIVLSFSLKTPYGFAAIGIILLALAIYNM